MTSFPKDPIRIDRLYLVDGPDESAWKVAAKPTTTLDELIALYTAVEWSAYTNEPLTLLGAVVGSSFVVGAAIDGQLVGLARAISDDASIFFLQDILVHPDHHRKGIASRLLRDCLERYSHVRQRVLVTGDEKAQRAFYESVGYQELRDTEFPGLCFVQYVFPKPSE